eukprot:COSAG02_NODE_7448_length_3009_cov_2.048454_6_plen_62_part_01
MGILCVSPELLRFRAKDKFVLQSDIDPELHGMIAFHCEHSRDPYCPTIPTSFQYLSDGCNFT